MHIGPAAETGVAKHSGYQVYYLIRDLAGPETTASLQPVVGDITRDTSDIHAMAVYLSYEKSSLQGMTKPLRNAASINRIGGKPGGDVGAHETARSNGSELSCPSKKEVHGHIAEFLKDEHEIKPQNSIFYLSV